MSWSFTAFVAHLSEGGKPMEEEVTRVLQDLGHALRRELKRRGMYELSPSLLGIPGHPHWRDGALEDLAQDAYVFNFLDRLPALIAQLRRQPTIDGTVLLNLRHLLTERQRAGDPIGFRVFEMTRDAVAAEIVEGRLLVLEGGARPPGRHRGGVKEGRWRLSNTTLLGFPGREEARVAAGEGELAPHAATWANELVPDIIVTRGAERRRLLRRLGQLISGLAEAGIGPFRFGHLVGPLKRSVRGCWAARLRARGPDRPPDGDGSDGILSHVFEEVGRELEDRDAFDALCAAVTQKIVRSHPVGLETRRILAVWQVLVLYCRAPEADESTPSERALASLTGVPRGQMRAILERIRVLVDAALDERQGGRS